ASDATPESIAPDCAPTSSTWTPASCRSAPQTATRVPSNENATPNVLTPAVAGGESTPVAVHSCSVMRRVAPASDAHTPRRSRENLSGGYVSNSPCTTSWLMRTFQAGFADQRVYSEAG